jgi:2-desacetyl-2-hydroxyethyl bacteriochlorophyllide A dehydrogenase
LRVFGVHLDGGMQEFLSVPITLLHKSEVLSLDQLALIETLGIGAHAVTRSGLKPGEKALIVGAGPIGISVVQFASALGAKVHVIERSESRRRFIQKLGFTATESMAGNLFDVVFDATGNSVAMGESLRYVATGGSLVFVGLSKDPVSFDDALFHRREITIFASRNSVGLFPGIIKLVEEGKIDTSHWITHRLPLSQVAYDFAPLTASQSLVKAIVDFQDYPELEEAVSSQ